MTKRNRLLLPLLLLLLLLLSLACTVYQVGGPGVVTPSPTVTTPLVTVTDSVTTPVVTPLATTPAPLVATVISTGLRVRSCAGLDCHEVAWLRRGDRVRVERCQNGWADLPSLGGWAKARYLTPDHCENK